jgi:hypothetical protein
MPFVAPGYTERPTLGSYGKRRRVQDSDTLLENLGGS